MEIYFIIGGGAIIIIVAIWLIATYNKIIKLQQQVQDQWSQISISLQKRYDLIPNLVNTAQGYARHEQTIFSEVAGARTAALSATTPAASALASRAVGGQVKRIFALGEAYPELKADQHFLQLQQSLQAVEQEIAYSRQFYNDTVLKYRRAVKQFPANLVAKLFKFPTEYEFFDIPEAQKQPVSIKPDSSPQV